MDQKLKKELLSAFEAPKPVKKDAFLRTHRRREMSNLRWLLTQVGYIRWYVWLGSVGVFLLMLILGRTVEPKNFWTVSSLTPLLALLAVSEGSRSRRHGMDELELACRMPVGAAVLARLTALGLFDLALLGAAAPVLGSWAGRRTLEAGVYLLTPYLLTAALGMELSRRFRGTVGLMYSAAAAGAVYALGNWLPGDRLYRAEALPIWWGALILTLAAAVFETYKTVERKEILQWS